MILSLVQIFDLKTVFTQTGRGPAKIVNDPFIFSVLGDVNMINRAIEVQYYKAIFFSVWCSGCHFFK